MDDSRVAVLLEDLLAKFQVFGEGLDALRAEVRQNAEQNGQEHRQMIEQNRREHQQMIEQNRREHQQMMQSIQELNNFQIELKRVKWEGTPS